MNNDDALPIDPDIDSQPVTAAELIKILSFVPPDAFVMTSVIKYPDEFQLKTDASTGSMRWDSGTDTEQQLLDPENVLLIDGIVYLVAELGDFDKDR